MHCDEWKRCRGELIGSVTLRNTRSVCRRGSDITVCQKRGTTTYQRIIPEANLKRFCQALEGSTLTVGEAVEALTTALGTAQKDLLNYESGHKRYYEVQDYLIAAVALKKASHEKQGRAFVYRIA